MLLAIESDASYLSIPKVQSRAAGFFFLTSNLPTRHQHFNPNGAIHILCHVMKQEVLSSATESELGASSITVRKPVPFALPFLKSAIPNRPLATVIITDNSTAVGIANDSVKQKWWKAMDMRLIRDRVRQGQFTIQ